jgi:toxin FitB
MGSGYLLDTNVVIYFLAGVLTEGGHEFLSKILKADDAKVSIITKIELLASNRLTDQEISVIDVFISYSDVHGLDDDVVDKASKFAGTIVRSNYQTRL